ncbi:MAG TPA: DUF1697 domain-containing protein [Solirubrobacteraceae bacterium]|nr:DUF1697 domain-containing protein [Solirubrobacteraceae bacterium]
MARKSSQRRQPPHHSQILFLRGINLGSHKRVSMPALRSLLGEAGFEDVRTYVASGNVVLSSSSDPAGVASRAEGLIAEQFGFDVDVIVRTRDELAEVVARNPLGDVAVDPRRYQVTFLDEEIEDAALARLDLLSFEPERLVSVGRELYTWHPEGIGRSKLWAKVASRGGLGATGTARNWNTVTTLLAMADES